MLAPAWKKNDRKASWLIIVFSIIVFTAVTVLGNYKLDIDTGFDVHLFALANAVINSVVTVLLIAALVAVKSRKYTTHRNLMMTAMVLSLLFLVSYICHHLFAGEARFGDINHDGIVSEAEKLQAGTLRYVYLVILITHIPLAGLILPFILFTAYRAQVGEWQRHRKLARITWPIWLYVAITGVVVYVLISPYYS